MAQDGIYWFNNQWETVAQKFSVASRILPEDLMRITGETLDRAATMMRETVWGEARIRTGAMYSSIDAKMTVSSRGRIGGHWGYIDRAPYWTVFQEYGTRGRHGGLDRHVNPEHGLVGETPGNAGIKPMHAFVNSAVMVEQELHDKISRIDFWREAGLR